MILYAGPSLTARSKQIIAELDIDLRPPVKRREIQYLTESGYRGVIAIVDGVFNQSAAVGHAEIRKAIQHGCTVYGLSSMGAIRAWEMRNLGMIGYGRVYSYFESMDDFQDDEMALLHGPGPDYFNFSEPMVHFRYCIDQLRESQQIDYQTADAILIKIKNRYFGERSTNLFVDALNDHGIVNTGAIIDNFEKYRIKSLDLITFLEETVWLNNSGS